MLESEKLKNKNIGGNHSSFVVDLNVIDCSSLRRTARMFEGSLIVWEKREGRRVLRSIVGALKADIANAGSSSLSLPLLNNDRTYPLSQLLLPQARSQKT